ncbi:hypothetical protein GALL_450070 [mine drainage metagenome]|uniref:Uncharacterized protein n=1 Tax=mine drainage metagenome TaxID=410659 RepID=A0A1J5Q008_9ZZZZ
MGGAVSADNAGAVHREQHWQVLDGHVVNHLVIATLQERGINRDHRLHAFAGQSCSESHRMLLGDADVEIALRKTLGELHQPRAFPHRRSDADQPRVGLCHVAQPLAEHLGERRLARLGRSQTDGRVELARTVIRHGIGLGQLVALALLGHDMQQHRAVQVTQVVQGGDQRVEIVSVDRAEILDSQFLEQGCRRHQPLGIFLQPPRQAQQRRRSAEHLLGGAARGGEQPA